MQEQSEVGKWVTDGKHTYPYNMYLDDLISNGTLKVCEKPVAKSQAMTPAAPLRSPATLTPDERAALAAQLGISVGEVGNMSPQELAAAQAELDTQASLNAGFVNS